MVTPEERAPLVCSKRLTLVIVAFFGNVFLYSARVNISLAIICMVRSDDTSNSTGLSESIEGNSSTFGTNGEMAEDGHKKEWEIDWTKSMQSHLLSMYFYGYICTQIIGGWMSARFGGRRVWGAAHFISAICTILTPVCARTHIYLACTMRFILGFAAGVSFPTMHTLMGRWAPPSDRSRMVSISFVGSAVGLVGTLAVSGFLCEYGFDNGWGSIFYLCGGFNLIWVLVWFLLIADSPAQHKTITERELKYIENGIGRGTVVDQMKTVPWFKLLTSMPIWAIFFASFSSNYFNYFLLTSLPLFMKEALEFDIKQNGLLSSLPYAAQIFGSLLTGYVADKVIHRKWLSVKNTRKLFQSWSLMGAAFFLVILVQMDSSQRYTAVMLLCFAAFARASFTAGYAVNHLDLAPRYAGLLFGLTNTTATIAGIIAPLIVGALTPNKTIDEWRAVFYVCAGVCALGSIAFVILGDGKLQSWAVENNSFEKVVILERMNDVEELNSDELIKSKVITEYGETSLVKSV